MSGDRPGRRLRGSTPYGHAAQTLSALMRDRRKTAGINQAELSRRAGVSMSTVSKIESQAVVEPGLFTVLSMCAAIDLPVADLAAVAAALPAAGPAGAAS